MEDAIESDGEDEALESLRREIETLEEASPIAIVAVDDEACVTRWSRRAEEIFGYRAEEVLGERIPLISEEELAELREDLERLFLADRLANREIERETKAGKRVVVTVSAAPIRDGEGRIREVVGFLQDVTDRKRRERALRASEQRFRRIFEEAGLGIALLGFDGRLQKANPALAEMLGYEPRDLVGLAFGELTHPDDVEQDERLFEELVEGERDRYTMEKRYVTAGDEVRWGRLTVTSITDARGEPAYILGMVEDITAQKEAVEELRFRARHDALTGLINRDTFEERLRQRLGLASESDDHGYAVLFIDLDDLKTINDRLGHGAGDDLLEEVGKRLRDLLRSGDSVARIGGDEFAVLLEQVEDREEATYVAERLQRGVAAPTTLEGEIVYPSASIGIAVGDATYQSAEELLRDADSAMYRVKNRGGGRTAVSRDEENQRRRHSTSLGEEVRSALDEGELDLRFRPVVELETGRLAAAIADPSLPGGDREEPAPEAIRRSAETIGVASELEHRLIAAACRAVETWQQRHPGAADLRLLVPCANPFCMRSSFVRTLGEMIEEYEYPEGTVTVGLPERKLWGERSGDFQAVESFRRRGLGIGVSDYGSGPMSLRLLDRVRADAVVLDPALVREGEAGDERRLLRTVLEAAESFGQRVIAPGISTSEERDWLMEAGCRLGEGPAIVGSLDLDALSDRLEACEGSGARPAFDPA